MAAIVLTTLVTIMYMGGLDILSGRPIAFEGDALFYYTYADVILRTGFPWFTSHLGAPTGFPLASFPQALTAEAIVIKSLALFGSDPVALLNQSWVILVAASSATSYAAFRLLRVRRDVSLLCSLLFALVPYAFFRNVSHFCLTTFSIPLPTAACILLHTDDLGRLSRRRFALVLIGCTSTGFTYVYNAFFACFALLVCIVAALLHRSQPLTIRRGCLCVLSLTFATGLNLVPSVVMWKSHGKPESIAYKTPRDADVYALRIRDLLLPHASSPIPGLAAIGIKDQEVPWPDQNERATAKLGTVGAIGFLLALIPILGRRIRLPEGHADAMRSASSILVLLLLLSIEGGFGSIFNLFVAPDIRCYNRILPFISFLSLFTIGAWLTAVPLRKPGPLAKGFPAILILIALFGVVDQDVSRGIRANQKAYAEQISDLRDQAKDIESRIPPNSVLYMLPLTNFPADAGKSRMRAYEHARYPLFARTLRWNWPTFGPAAEAWQRSLPLAGPEFREALIRAGFTHVWIDRAGFDDRAVAKLAELESWGCTTVVTAAEDRLVVLSLSPR